MIFSKKFKRQIIITIIGGMITLTGIYFGNKLASNDGEFALKKTTETTSPDGTITKDETIVYK